MILILNVDVYVYLKRFLDVRFYYFLDLTGDLLVVFGT